MCVCALDTELLGHWWYEGVQWLAAVVEEAARQGLTLTTLDDALDRHRAGAGPAGGLGVSSWGEGGTCAPGAAPRSPTSPGRRGRPSCARLAAGGRPSDRALRELLALQSSDWAFLATDGTAGEYPRERAAGHAEALAAALSTDTTLEPGLRNLAPDLAGWLA